MSVLKPCDVDLSRIRYSEPRQNAAGGRTIYTSYVADDGSEQKMYVQTPEMYLPFGLSSWENKKFNIDLSFSNPLEGNQKVFSEMLGAFDKKIVKDALDHSADWLKKKFKAKDLPILQECL